MKVKDVVLIFNTLLIIATLWMSLQIGIDMLLGVVVFYALTMPTVFRFVLKE